MEKSRLESLEQIRQKAKTMSEAKEENDYKKTMQELNVLNSKYQNIKILARFLDTSIFIGIVVAIVCAYAFFVVFSSTQVTLTLNILLLVAVCGFVLEVFLLLAVVLYQLKSTRKTILKELPGVSSAKGTYVGTYREVKIFKKQDKYFANALGQDLNSGSLEGIKVDIGNVLGK